MSHRGHGNTVLWVLAGLWCLSGCGPAEPRKVLLREDGQWIEVAAVKGTPRGELALIQLHLADKEYKEVIKAAEKFRERYPVDFRREDVSMLAGHAQMRRGYYVKAYEWYTRQLDEFPAGELFEEALDREFQIAEAFLGGRKQVWEIIGVWSLEIVRISAVDEAVNILMQIAERAPTSELAEKALLRIADHHYDEKDYQEAAQAYDAYLAMFPRNRMSPYAQLRAARAVYATYRDARYDSTPLVNASLRFKAYATAYPDRVGDEGIDKTIEEIANLQAGADYYVAELFERLDRPDAAAFFYDQAARRYGKTTWTSRAQAARRRLAPKPDAPRNGADP